MGDCSPCLTLKRKGQAHMKRLELNGRARLGLCLMSLVSLVLSGCREDSSDAAAEATTNGAAVNRATCATANVAAASSPTVVRIDGHALTKREVLRNGKAMLTLNMNKMRRTKVGRKDWDYLTRYCADAAEREIGRAAVRRYIRDRGLTPDSNTVARLTRAFERRYGVKSKKLRRWHTVDDLKYMLGKNGFRVDAEIRDRIDYATATNDILKTHPVVVTDGQVRARLQEIADYNVRARATNAVVFAQATNVWRQIADKRISFEDAAKKYSEDAYIADGCEWGLFTRDQLSDETELLKALPSLKVGDVTPPIESDGGLAILRMDESDTPENVALSRVFFRLPMYFTEESPAEARAELMGRLERERISETLKGIAKKLKIDYPDGTNVFSSGGSPVVITPAEFSTCDR